jgi:hypothetical protein
LPSIWLLLLVAACSAVCIEAAESGRQPRCGDARVFAAQAKSRPDGARRGDALGRCASDPRRSS